MDVEVSPAKVYTWGMWEQNVIKVVEQPFMLCFAYQWLGQKTEVLALPDFPNYKKDKHDDKALIQALRDILDKADVVIGQNSRKFDVKWFNTRCATHHIKPPSPFKQIDTLELSKKYFKWLSNKLDFVSERLGHGHKAETGGFELWERCMAGCPKAWKKMKKYNKHDVDITAEVYLDYVPWLQKEPVWSKTPCPHCQSTDTQRRGEAANLKGRFQRHQCLECSKWFLGSQIIHKV